MDSTSPGSDDAGKDGDEALRASEERFRAMADNIPQLAWMANLDGYIFWYNRRWYDYTGTTFEQMQGWGWQSVHDPKMLPIVMERWKQSIATGEPFDMVFPLKGADGVFRPFLTRVAPYKDASGKVLNWFGSNTDISELRALEDALRDANLRKDEYLAMLAHELRNPLAAISNAAHVLRNSDGDAATVQSSSEILERQIAHMIRQVDDLLDVSRINRGKIELHKERIELGSVVQHAVEAARPLCEKLCHELFVTLPEHPIYVNGDSIRLTQVVGNLLNNACKFTDQGGRIWMTLESAGDEAVIKVRDSGIGIPAEELARIFEIFIQVDKSLERSRDGLGLGLALVKNLVELHGGEIEARSAGPGQGSEFVVSLPRLTEAGIESDGAPAGAKPANAVFHRLLVVDDNRDSANSLAMLLKLIGHEVDTAHDGLEAIGRVPQYRPSVVLLDIGMPGLNGYETARRIREQHDRNGLRLVALTGWNQEEDRRRSEEAGFDAHLVKPVDMAALNRLLADWGGDGQLR